MDPTKLVENLLGVGKELIGLAREIRAGRIEHRREIAKLMDKISRCLAAVASEIRLGRVPHGKCGQIDMYAHELQTLLGRALKKKTAERLARTLSSSHRVEGLAIALKNTRAKEKHLAKLEEASGKFRAVANMLRAR